MRIIGGKDYYDIALAYGRDESDVFVRGQRHDVDVKNSPLQGELGMAMPYFKQFGEDVSRYRYGRGHTFQQLIEYGTGYTLRWSISAIVIFFCGKRYPLIEVSTYINTGTYAHYFYNRDAFIRWLHMKGWDIAWESPYRTSGFCDVQMVTTEKWFTAPVSQPVYDWLVENRVTIAIGPFQIEDRPLNEKLWWDWHIDTAELSKYEFTKVCDPYTAFQEISMWRGNLAFPGKPMVEIVDDKIKVAKHGFDNYSFRKPKETK